MKKFEVFLTILCVFSLIISCISINSIKIIEPEQSAPFINSDGFWYINGKCTYKPATVIYDAFCDWDNLQVKDKIALNFYMSRYDTKTRIAYGYYYSHNLKQICVKIYNLDAYINMELYSPHEPLIITGEIMTKIQSDQWIIAITATNVEL
jgi:hypothetical protein